MNGGKGVDKMPPGGIHLAAGLALSRFVLPRLPGVVPRKHHASFRSAVVFGSISPDLDLFPTALLVAWTYDKAWVDILHRTASHSLPVLTVIAALYIVLGRWMAQQRTKSKGAHVA